MPKKPIFPDLRITRNDRTRLQRSLTTWASLNTLFLSASPSATDLRKMIIVEQGGANRPHILRRLIGRLHTTERNNYYRLLGLD